MPELPAFLAMPAIDLIARYRKGVENYDRRLFQLDESRLNHAFLAPRAGEADAGRWPVRVLLGHLADAEVSFVARFRRIVGEDAPVLEAWDENSFIDADVYGVRASEAALPTLSEEAKAARASHALGGFIAVVHTLRQWAGSWLLTLPPEAFERRALHPTRGEITLRFVLAYATWHLEHHASILRRKLDKLVGDATPGAPAAQPAPSCGPGCGCAPPKPSHPAS